MRKFFSLAIVVMATALAHGQATLFNTVQPAGTTSISATTLTTVSSSGPNTYLMGGYLNVTVVGTGCTSNTTVQLNAVFTDPAAAGSTTLALGVLTVTNNGTAGNSLSIPLTPIRGKASSTVQFSTTYTAGASCSPAPTVQVEPILIQAGGPN